MARDVGSRVDSAVSFVLQNAAIIPGTVLNSARRPALERRARFVERQPITVRRRSVRVLSRLCVILGFDVLVFLAARATATGFFEPIAIAGRSGEQVAMAGPLATPGAPASLVFPIVFLAALVLTGAYARHRAFVWLRVLVATTIASIATAVTLATLVGVKAGLVHAGLFGFVCLPYTLAGRGLADRFLHRVWPRNRGAQAAVRLFASFDKALAHPKKWGDYIFADEAHVSADISPPDFSATFQKLHELAIAGVEVLVITDDLPDEKLVPLISGALDLGYRIIYPARAVSTEEGIRPRLVWHGGEPFFEISTPVLRASAVFTKRVVDILGALILMFLASPLMALIAIAIVLDSPGPVFFAQDRAGLGGRRFRMLKFRTMAAGADGRKQELAHLNRSGDVRLFKIPDDPRVTRIGSGLRRWSLDELPQLINVIKGDMSLVGPRPFFESDFSEYEDRHFRRLDTKPGITGLWQVSGRSDLVEFEDVVFLDRQYIEQWSLWLDLSILARTIPAVLRRHGAY